MNKTIYEQIFAHKTTFMGIAICLIFLFHTELDSSCLWITFPKELCDIGVDLFMFLSGFSLAFSFSKCPQIKVFYMKRMMRILPAYLAVFIPFYFYKDIIAHHDTWMVFLYHLSFLNYFIEGDLIIWFIPVVICYYFLLPFYVKGVREYPLLRFVPYILIAILAGMQITQTPIPTGFLLVRLPIFLLGANVYLFPKELFSHTWQYALMAFVSIVGCYYVLILNSELWGIKYLFYIPLCFIILNYSLICIVRSEVISFLGMYTLEFYLIHERVIWTLHKHILNQYVLACISILITILLGYLLHKTLLLFIK